MQQAHNYKLSNDKLDSHVANSRKIIDNDYPFLNVPAENHYYSLAYVCICMCVVNTLLLLVNALSEDNHLRHVL